METKELIAKNIVYYRKLNKMTQNDLALKLNYSDKAVSKWERGEATPDVELLTKIAAIFNISLSCLITSDAETKVRTKDEFTPEARNKLVLVLLIISILWIIATIMFVYSKLITNTYYWMAFIYPIPLSFMLLNYYNYKTRRNQLQGIIYKSGFIWSLILA